MDHYYHAVPGRLRIKTPFAKRNPEVVSDIERLLIQCDGLQTISSNPLTGSIVITYDPRKITHQKILSLLQEEGYFDSTNALSSDEQLGKLLGGIVEMAFQRTAFSLVSALL
jgi:hypothetical protein